LESIADTSPIETGFVEVLGDYLLILHHWCFLLIVQHRLWCKFNQFKLVTHFLQAHSKSFNLLLLLGYGRFLA
jgi:hypothetical protein